MSKYCITDERFINPYNFVSISETVERCAAKPGTLSGTICCELETLSPLFIPNTTKDKAFGTQYSHSYDFFSYEDLNERGDYRQNPARPIIPGSSIRGVIRSAFEAATNGCMSTCDDDNTLYRRTPVPRKQFGIIEKDADTGERILYKAAKWKLPVSQRASHKTGDALRGGIYLRGENFSTKKNDAIMKYELDKSGNKIELLRFSEDSREWTNLVEVWRLYQHRDGKIKGVNQSIDNSGYPDYLNAEQIPVYYAKLDNYDFYYFAPAAITKEVFSRTLNELLKKQGEHNPCEHSDYLCQTCRLFGMVGEDAVASRLFFRDATPIIDCETSEWRDYYDSVRALPVLASPKVSSTEFYMDDVVGSAYFNYDYFVNYYPYYDKHGKPADAPVRSFLDNPKLRGRKLYWHRKNIMLDPTTNFGSQRTEIRPVSTGKKFKFEVGFDRVTQTELETLLWALTFGEHKATHATHAHKLGHAKPYGYGSVRIVKADVVVATLSEDLTLITSVSVNVSPKAPPYSIALREYLALTDFSRASDNVKYPVGDNGSRTNPKGVYQWFGINKEIRMGGMKPSFNYVLPKPLDDDVSLPGYIKKSGPIGGKPTEIGGNRTEIRNADAPETDSDVSAPIKQKSQGTTLGNVLRLQQESKTAKSTPKFGTFKGPDIKAWLSPLKYDPKTMKSLQAFVRDFERAESENDKRYKDIVHLYNLAKEKLSNV
jgi:CRISPR/Cas system CSM-associated protein Csm3 (group 7 of RAMP superfamily)